MTDDDPTPGPDAISTEGFIATWAGWQASTVTFPDGTVGPAIQMVFGQAPDTEGGEPTYQTINLVLPTDAMRAFAAGVRQCTYDAISAARTGQPARRTPSLGGNRQTRRRRR